MKNQVEVVNGKRAFSYLRWSTAPQEWGTSEIRQSGLAKAYCEQHELTLVDTVSDRGVSAYRGKNRTRALGDLVDAIKANDYLLVEDVDRLSRQDWLTAVTFVGQILDKGVTIVTLHDGQRIDAKAFRQNPGTFLPVILRSHRMVWPSGGVGTCCPLAAY